VEREGRAATASNYHSTPKSESILFSEKIECDRFLQQNLRQWLAFTTSPTSSVYRVTGPATIN
jgi:hypothetical protein